VSSVSIWEQQFSVFFVKKTIVCITIITFLCFLLLVYLTLVILLEQLTPEMEKMLVQQVLGMSAEQINMLPPEQRQQVLQLRDMLRQ
jgi:hypothetical protein